MKRRRSWVGSLAMLACLACPSRLIAQSTTGTIRGTITDEQNAVVPGATVTIRNVATKAVRKAVSEKDGFYRFLSVPVGEYELTIEKGGFSKYLRSGITLSLNRQRRRVVDQEHEIAAEPESPDSRGDVQCDEHAEFRDSRQPGQFRRVPQSVGDRRRSPEDLGGRPLYLLKKA